MEQIIAGRLESLAKAHALAIILKEFISPLDICIFYNDPSGQSEVLPTGSDETIDVHINAENDGIETSKSRALPLTGYTGALIGTVFDRRPTRRRTGVILALRVANPNNRTLIVGTLKNAGVGDIEVAQGKWHS